MREREKGPGMETERHRDGESGCNKKMTADKPIFCRSTETGTGMQAIVGSKEGSVKFFRAKDQKAEGRHVKEGEDPLLDHKGTMTLRTTRRRHEAHAAAVTWVSASEDGAMAATSSMDKTLIL